MPSRYDPFAEPAAAQPLRMPKIVGYVLAVAAVPLIAGGLWLVSLGGSAYYLGAGAVLATSGVLLMRGERSGAWLYIAGYFCTWAWAVAEVGFQFGALIPRIGPGTVLLPFVAAVVPQTDGHNWQARATGGLALVAAAVAAGLVMLRVDDAAVTQSRVAVNAQSSMGDGATFDQPADGITSRNAHLLEQLWDYDNDIDGTGLGPPLAIDDSLLFCTASDVVLSVDAATGEENWRFDPDVYDGEIPAEAACRGLTHHRQAQPDADGECSDRVIQATQDGRLLALDLQTGRQCPGFGENGAARVTDDIDRDRFSWFSVIRQPVLVSGVAVVGLRVGATRDDPNAINMLRGFDAESGRKLWSRDRQGPSSGSAPVSSDESTAIATADWLTLTADAQLGRVYVAAGGATAINGDAAPTANVQPEPVIIAAINATDGRLAWQRPAPSVSRSTRSPGLVMDVTTIGTGTNARPVILTIGSFGNVFVMDRRTGESITVDAGSSPVRDSAPALPSVANAAGSLADLRSSPADAADMWGISPFDQLWCRIRYHHAGVTASRPPEDFAELNSVAGLAADPKLGILVAAYEEAHTYVFDARGAAASAPDQRDVGERPQGQPDAAARQYESAAASWSLPDLPLTHCKEPPYRWITAIDMMTGEELWRVPQDDSGPGGILSLAGRDSPSPASGPAMTDNGLTLNVSSGVLRIVDTASGELLTSMALPGRSLSRTVSVRSGGQELILVTGTGDPGTGDSRAAEVIAYRVPPGRGDT